MPSVALDEEEEEEVLKRVGRSRQSQLFREIDDLYERVETGLSGHVVAPKATTALKRLRLARDILMEYPRQFDEAEYQIGQVRLLLARTAQSHEWARRYGTRLFVYEIGWFLLLMAGVIFSNQWTHGLVLATGMTLAQVEDLLVPLINTMIWGGIGGVLGAIYNLRWHVADKQDFDKEYNIWYLANPFVGVVLGGIVYLISRAGLLAAQISPGATGATKWLTSVVACLVGFREKFALELLDRLIQVIARGPEAPAEEEAEVKLSPPAQPPPSSQ